MAGAALGMLSAVLERDRMAGVRRPLDFMKLATAEALTGVHKNHGGPFGAVIVRRGKVVAKAHNEVVSSFDPTAHAEIMAIRKASTGLKTFDLSGCELYTTCEPCPMCLAAILWARIGKVYYGCTRGDAGTIGFRDDMFYKTMRVRPRPAGIRLVRVGRRECLKVFRAWVDKPDEVPY